MYRWRFLVLSNASPTRLPFLTSRSGAPTLVWVCDSGDDFTYCNSKLTTRSLALSRAQTDRQRDRQTHTHTHTQTHTYTFTCTFNAATDNAQSTQTLVKYRCTWKSPNRLHLTTSTRWLPAYCSFYLEWDGWTDCFPTKLSMETGRDRSPRKLWERYWRGPKSQSVSER